MASLSDRSAIQRYGCAMQRELSELERRVRLMISDWVRWIAAKSGRSATEIGANALTRAMNQPLEGSLPTLSTLVAAANETGLPLPDLAGAAAVPIDGERLRQALMLSAAAMDIPTPHIFARNLAPLCQSTYLDIMAAEERAARRFEDADLFVTDRIRLRLPRRRAWNQF